MKKINLAVTGCLGRMGQQIIKSSKLDRKFKIVTLTENRKINKKISSLCGFKEGKWWVQDISSSIPVKLLGDVKGKEVLDLFSAPGGKSMQLIALGANVTCVDQSLKRIKIF